MDFKGKIFIHKDGYKRLQSWLWQLYQTVWYSKGTWWHLLLKTIGKKNGLHRRKYPMVSTNCVHLLFIYGNLIKYCLLQCHPNTSQIELYLGLCSTPWIWTLPHSRIQLLWLMKNPKILIAERLTDVFWFCLFCLFVFIKKVKLAQFYLAWSICTVPSASSQTTNKY